MERFTDQTQKNADNNKNFDYMRQPKKTRAKMVQSLLNQKLSYRAINSKNFWLTNCPDTGKKMIQIAVENSVVPPGIKFSIKELMDEKNFNEKEYSFFGTEKYTEGEPEKNKQVARENLKVRLSEKEEYTLDEIKFILVNLQERKKLWTTKELSSVSLTNYARAFEYLSKKAEDENIDPHQISPLKHYLDNDLHVNTFYTYKSAFIYRTQERAEELLDMYQTYSNSPKTFKMLQAEIRYLAKLYAEQLPENQTGKHGRKKSKRSSAKNLPDDWHEKIENNIYYKHKDACIVLNATGCRASEIVRGVTLQYNPKKALLTAKIFGSKQKDGTKFASGQIREISFDTRLGPGQKMYNHFKSKLDENNEVFVKADVSPAGFKDAYKRGAKKGLGEKVGKRISPNTARHKFKTKLKEDKMDDVEVALAMGHQSTISQARYGGNNGKGKGGMGIRSVKGSSPVRQYNRTPALRSGPSISF
ncbi:MAG: site-specific integrase, partial [Bacteroidota bacterium]